METVVIVAIVLIVAAIGLYVFMSWRQKRRTESLRGQFGPEYDRALGDKGDRKSAESDLMARSDRRSKLEIRPLDPAARDRYLESWRDTQANFVDDPGRAIREADALIILVMRDRGYPIDDFEQRSADVSVDHPTVVENYRAAHAVSQANDRSEATTEDLRQAMVHYRELFRDLLETDDRVVGDHDERQPSQRTDVVDAGDHTVRRTR
jgi:hypothetical protein